MLVDRGFEVIEFNMWLKDEDLSNSTIQKYTTIISNFLSRGPDVNSLDSYMSFLVETAKKKRNYSNTYAIFKYIDYKLKNPLKNQLINSIKEFKFAQPDPVKYMDKKPLNEDEMNIVIDNLEFEKHKIMSYLMYITGIRVGDALNIKLNSIYEELEGDEMVTKINVHTKGGKYRKLWIWDRTFAKLLIDFCYEPSNDFGTGYHFREPRKIKDFSNNIWDKELKLKNYNYNQFLIDLKQALDKAGIDRQRFASHSYRRNYAKRVWNKFNDLDIMQRMMGHSDIRSTIRYLRNHGYDISKAMKKIQGVSETEETGESKEEQYRTELNKAQETIRALEFKLDRYVNG